MEPIFNQTFQINDMCVDCFGRMKLSAILFLAQEVAGQHCDLLAVDYDTLLRKKMLLLISKISGTLMMKCWKCLLRTAD